MRTLLEILLPMPNTYTILGDHSPWGTGRNHLQDDATESSATLCGRSLGFNFETVLHESGRLLHGVEIETVLKYEKSVCKTCMQVFNKNIK